MSKLSVSKLYEDLREVLELSILSGESGMGRQIQHTHFQKNGLPLAGFLKAVHPDRVQVWGSTEIGFFGVSHRGGKRRGCAQVFSHATVRDFGNRREICSLEYQGSIRSGWCADHSLGVAGQGFDAEIVRVSRRAPFSTWPGCMVFLLIYMASVYSFRERAASGKASAPSISSQEVIGSLPTM